MLAAALLLVAIVIEVMATALLPKTQSFTDPLWSAVVIAGFGASIWLLTIVVRTMPVSIAYAVWAGVGTALVAVVGYVFLDESMGWAKIAALTLIVLGVVGLNLAGVA